MARRPDTVTTNSRTVDVTDSDRRDHVEHGRAVTPVVAGNGSAIAAFVLGLFAATFAFTGIAAIAGILFGILAIGFGIAGVSKANTLAGMNKGLAVSGIVAGALGLLLSIAIAIGAVAAFNQVQNDPALQNRIEEGVEDATQ